MMQYSFAAAALLCLCASARTQRIWFDFDSAPLYRPLPVDVTAGGITAHLSATGQGYSIQSSSTVPIVPAGFRGRFLYPSSVFPADLLVSFSQTVNGFSILYSPQELGCDDSCRMRVTAYLGMAFVGTNTVTARYPGTWPSETLSCTFPQGFDRVVVHYDQRPPTCRDWGPIFLADNMSVLVGPVHANGSFTAFGAGCPGSNGVPLHQATGTPETGFIATYGLTRGPVDSVGVLMLGASADNWNGIPLPFDLTPLGYPGCTLYTAVALGLSAEIDGSGTASVPLPIPLANALVGNHVYSQYLVLDGATLRFSNAIDTLVGGDL
jgi:hypothetical protein